MVNNPKNNPEKFSTTKIGKRIPSGYSPSTFWANLICIAENTV